MLGQGRNSTYKYKDLVTAYKTEVQNKWASLNHAGMCMQVFYSLYAKVDCGLEALSTYSLLNVKTKRISRENPILKYITSLILRNEGQIKLKNTSYFIL